MVQKERGAALLIVLMLSVVISLLVLSLSLSSLRESQISVEFENHERAMVIADAGLNALKGAFKGQDLDDLLSRETAVPSYIPDSSPRQFDYRNPINLKEARNVDFETAAGTGTRTDHGWLTPPEGMPIGTGLYFAKLSDNADDGDLYADSDGTVCLRIIGIQRGSGVSENTNSTTRKNAVAVVEALLKRDTTFDLQAPLTIPASDTTNSFGGAKFKVDGFDHSSIWKSTDDIGDHDDSTLPDHPGVNVVYDDPPTNSQPTVDKMIDYTSKNEKNNFTGTGGTPTTPSIVDGTVAVKADPDAKKILDAKFLDNFVKYVSVYADERVAAGNSPTSLGTEAHPRVVLAEDDLKLTGNDTGWGLLVVKGELNVKGTFAYNGMVLVVGKGSLDIGGAANMLGGIVVANITPAKTLGTASLSVHGGGNKEAGIYNASDKIALGMNLLPMRVISWREITPEIEP